MRRRRARRSARRLGPTTFIAVLIVLLAAPVLVAPLAGEAQQARIHRIGVILQGGPYVADVEGLRDGLKELGLVEAKHFVLDVRDTKGDLTLVESTARGLERTP